MIWLLLLLLLLLPIPNPSSFVVASFLAMAAVTSSALAYTYCSLLRRHPSVCSCIESIKTSSSASSDSSSLTSRRAASLSSSRLRSLADAVLQSVALPPFQMMQFFDALWIKPMPSRTLVMS